MQGTTTEDLKLKENKKIQLTKMIHKCKDARYERQLPATADIRNYKGRLGRRVGAERGLFFFFTHLEYPHIHRRVTTPGLEHSWSQEQTGSRAGEPVVLHILWFMMGQRMGLCSKWSTSHCSFAATEPWALGRREGEMSV